MYEARESVDTPAATTDLMRPTQAVENMCVHKLSASMLEKLRTMCESHIEGLVKSLQEYPACLAVLCCGCAGVVAVLPASHHHPH